MNHYTGNITPGKDIIFVFGSNPEGKHGAGSAKVALQKFGAKNGKGDGLHGQSYALITTEMRKGWPRITLEQITDNVRRMYEVARKMPDKRFMVAYRNQPDQRTLCGYTGAQMMKCFLSAGDIPDNIWFSEEWYKAITKQVQNAFMEQLDGREPYYYWKEIPPTKIWYNETDNCFHTSDGITHEFKGYELDDMRFCLQDLYLKIIATYKSKGITIHDEIED